ncbi:hypothetical protein CAEBREN_21036 [Caenorhabditis brenneri]|uniref:Glycoside hydrolase family 31 TIM barrel domain-containing protein n=1 Tax=Caenorhabditis brenneri TaxID=135651 RepID=G0PAM2_CAEBE|nr:hypothetical protein CAEBREN_21036 [Caenorhabditis brenneri]
MLFQHNLDRYTTWPMFARDIGPDSGSALSTQNLYGVHPFYMCIESDGKAHGVFILNSNAQEVETGPGPHLVYRTIGGRIDMAFFPGPTPEEVVNQYLQHIGFPFLPAYWALGYQLCRWGYGSLDAMKTVISRNQALGIPLDVPYADIDYMNHYEDFTEGDNWSGFPAYTQQLHSQGLHLIVIFDPAVEVDYASFQRGINQDASFIEWARDDQVPHNIQDQYPMAKNTRVMLGNVWPERNTAFPDFLDTKNNTNNWWAGEFATFHKTLPFDGMWIDMNEPSNFDTGTYSSMEEQLATSKLSCPISGADASLEIPPYPTQAVYQRSGEYLFSKTLCMLGKTARRSRNFYDTKNLYGWSEARATYQAIPLVTGKRSAVISRSTFPSSGRYGGHWLGDNTARWEDLQTSVIGVMEFNMFGIPYVGSDICGFNGVSNEELCLRWHQFGAFSPFSSLHYNAARYGHTVIRPLFFEFPKDEETLTISEQFLWGSALMIAPALYQLPFDGMWIDMNEPSNFDTGTYSSMEEQLATSKLSCPISGADASLEIPPYPTQAVYQRSGEYLFSKTLCMLGKTARRSRNFYDTKNLYGWSEARATYQAIPLVTGKRSAVISRSTFPSSGRYGGHWLGDNTARWEDLQTSVIGVMEFNMFGIPYVGSDICGFNGVSNEELCLRWHQFGAFSPFSRDHNSEGMPDQDPAVWPSVANAAKIALSFRYYYLPFLYRWVENASFIEWARDDQVPHNIQDQYPMAKNTRVMLGNVWPERNTAFPDFLDTKNNTNNWWAGEFATFHKTLPFDGMWIDMNEPSNFDTGTYSSMEEQLATSKLSCPISGADASLEIPPYPTQAVYQRSGEYLFSKTLCMLGKTARRSRNFYDTKNLYGWSEARATYQAIPLVTGKRSAVISRSTFPSSGRYGGHWLGDNTARWEDLQTSVIGVMEFNMFGIPYVGSDICGFNGVSNEELCLRWHQFGAFSPFSRDHNSEGMPDQDPAVWPSVANAAKIALSFRYYYLPFLYSGFA